MEDYITTQLYIDSGNISTGNNENFKLYIYPQIQKACAYAINSVSIPASYLNMYPSSSTLRFDMTFSVSGAQSFTIPNLNYNDQTLASAMETAVNAVITGTFDVSFVNGVCTFTSSVETFSISAGDLGQATSLYPFLGFTTAVVAVSTATGTNQYNLSGPNSLYIASRSLTTNKNYLSLGDRLSNNNVIHRVYVDENTGTTIQNTNLNVVWTQLPSQNLSALDFTLYRADTGALEIVDLRGLEWNMTMTIKSSGSY